MVRFQSAHTVLGWKAVFRVEAFLRDRTGRVDRRRHESRLSKVRKQVGEPHRTGSLESERRGLGRRKRPTSQSGSQKRQGV